MARCGWLLCLFALTCCASQTRETQARAGAPAPAFALESTRGRPISLAALRGHPVYVNFFASWCAPCNDEAPSIRRLYAKYRPQGLRVVAIDELESAAKAHAFARKYAWPFLVAVDPDGKLGPSYGALGLPVHVFVDKRGVVSTYRLGQMDSSAIEAAIKKIL